MWRRQHELSDLVDSDRKEIWVPTGHGIGKTFHAANIVAWWMARWGPGTTVITSAPTFRQVEELLWRELKTRWNSIPSLLKLGEVHTTELEIGSDWKAYGFSTDDPNKFQGWHAPHLFVLIDEANGFPEPLWEALDSCMTGTHTQLVALGNTIVPQGRFYERCESEDACVLRVSSREHPNVVYDREIVPGAVTKEWIDKIEKRYRSFPEIIKARVDAIFPSLSANTLLSKPQFDAATQIKLKQVWPVVLSCDIARFGNNASVLSVFIGATLKEQISWGATSINESADRIRTFANKFNAQFIVVDDDGVGGGVTDLCNHVGLPVIAYRGGMPSDAPEHYYNIASEAYSVVKTYITEGIISIDNNLVTLDDLRKQLTLREYSFDPKGRFCIEQKKKFIQRTGLQSPDESDSFAMGIWWLNRIWTSALENK